MPRIILRSGLRISRNTAKKYVQRYLGMQMTWWCVLRYCKQGYTQSFTCIPRYNTSIFSCPSCCHNKSLHCHLAVRTKQKKEMTEKQHSEFTSLVSLPRLTVTVFSAYMDVILSARYSALIKIKINVAGCLFNPAAPNVFHQTVPQIHLCVCVNGP